MKATESITHLRYYCSEPTCKGHAPGPTQSCDTRDETVLLILDAKRQKAIDLAIKCMTNHILDGRDTIFLTKTTACEVLKILKEAKR